MPSGPLSGVRVVDVTQNVAGPFCTQILADLGADVIKVEPPGGDSTRGWKPPEWGEHSVMFAAFNRNKRSVVLDLRTPQGRELLDRLLAGADVLVSALRPSAARTLRLDAPSIQAAHPTLTVCEITAYGPEGPMAGQAGYEPMIQAFAGLMSINGHQGSPPARLPTSVVDMATGMWAAIGTLACLLQRTGSIIRPRRVQTSLFETALGWLPYQILGYLVTGDPPRQWGSEFATIVPYGAYRAADREVMVAVGNERLWRSFCSVLGQPELIDDPRFATNAARVANRAALRRVIEDALRADSAASWVGRLSAAGVPATLVNTIPDALEHPQTAATGMLERPARDMPLVGLPILLDGDRPPMRQAPPRCGEHTRSVLRDELNLSDDDIDRLERDGIVAQL